MGEGEGCEVLFSLLNCTIPTSEDLVKIVRMVRIHDCFTRKGRSAFEIST